jgi:voltage-gated potassium channel
MISLILTIAGLLTAIYYASKDNEFRALGFILVFLLALGTSFYSYAEKWSIIDSLYFCAMTITTIGYGDLSPSSEISKVFTIIYAFVGIGAFVAFAAKIAYALTTHRRKRQKAREQGKLNRYR